MYNPWFLHSLKSPVRDFESLSWEKQNLTCVHLQHLRHRDFYLPALQQVLTVHAMICDPSSCGNWTLPHMQSFHFNDYFTFCFERCTIKCLYPCVAQLQHAKTSACPACERLSVAHLCNTVLEMNTNHISFRKTKFCIPNLWLSTGSCFGFHLHVD